MNNPGHATIVAVFLSAFFVLGIMYLAFGERLGIKSAGPNARLHVEAADAK